MSDPAVDAPPFPRRPRRSVTIRDVAHVAGVSEKTVSNVVRGYTFVSEENRERVQAAIASLGYRPNLTARSLRTGRTGVIALAVPYLDVPYFAELASQVVRAASRQGLTVLVDQTNGRRDAEQEAVSGIRDHMIDGVLISPLELTEDDLRDADRGVPLVLLGEHMNPPGTEELPVDSVAIDNVAAAREATGALLDAGRRRIALIGLGDQRTARLRVQGWEEALRERGVPRPPAALTAHGGAWTRRDGADAVQALVDCGEPFDAVFCGNDLLALGAMHRARELGLRAPVDVAFVGIDDIEDGRYSTPPLTTVAPDKAGLAETAVAALVSRLGERGRPGTRHLVPHRLVVRGSALPSDVAP